MIFLPLAIILNSRFAPIQTQNSKPTATAQVVPDGGRIRSVVGDLRLILNFHSTILNNDRTIRIWFPPGYAASPNARYPVLYMNDGQNLFDGMTSYLPNEEWRCDETAFALIQSKLISPIIIVGIDNAGADRGNEYLPTYSSKYHFGGKANLYAQFVTKELKPYIDSHFHTRPDRANTAMGGSSFGGIISLYIGLNDSSLFSKILIISPSVWWDNKVIINRVADLPKKLPLKIWLDIGTNEETNDPSPRNYADQLAKAFENKGWVQGKDLAYFVDYGAQHNEFAWSRRFGMMLLYMYGNITPSAN